MSGNSLPALVLLALDVSLRGFALGVERVEGLFQALVRRFARVNGATDALVHWVSFFLFKPKKTGPDHLVPVMALAISVRLR